MNLKTLPILILALFLSGCAGLMEREPPEITAYTPVGGEREQFDEGLRLYRLSREEQSMEIMEPLARQGYPKALRFIAKKGDHKIEATDNCEYREPHWSIEALSRQGDPDAIMAYWNCVSKFGGTHRFLPKDGLFYLEHLSQQGHLDATYALYEHHISYMRSNAAPIPGGWITQSHDWTRAPNLEKAAKYADRYANYLKDASADMYLQRDIARFVHMQMSVANSFVAVQQDAKASARYHTFIALADSIAASIGVSQNNLKKLQRQQAFAEKQLSLLKG